MVARQDNGRKDNCSTTSCQLGDLAKRYLERLHQRLQEKPFEVLEAWPQVVDPRYIAMTRAIKFDSKVLYVAVKNSTLLSILHEPSQKQKLLAALRAKGANISDIVFRIG